MSYQDYFVNTRETALTVRKGPGQHFPKVGTVEKGSRITVDGSKAPWKKLTGGNWVHGDYLRPATSGPNTGPVRTVLGGSAPASVKSLDNEDIPVPTEVIRRAPGGTRLIVTPYANGNTYRMVISHHSLSGDAEALLYSMVGGIGTGAATGVGGGKLGWVGKKALGVGLKSVVSAVVGVAGGALASTHIAHGGKPVLVTFSNGLKVVYVLVRK